MVKFWQGLTVFLISCLLLISLTACGNQVRRNQVVISVLSDPKTFNAVLSAESPNIFGLDHHGVHQLLSSISTFFAIWNHT